MSPALPSHCPQGIDSTKSLCSITIDHFRHRKTGPQHPLGVARCSTHALAFTLYPARFAPYRRQAVINTSPGARIKMADHVSSRQYHSTALLLPSGKVLVGGGDVRSWDYEVYSPPYIFCGTRPQITAIQATNLNPGTSYTVDFVALPQTPPTQVERVVLMRPGSVTHASCMDQRYISLELSRPLPGGATRVTFKTPASSKLAPRGYYMLFLVTNLGVPSVATWVRLL